MATHIFITHRERWLLALAVFLLALAFGPAVSQAADYHQFADQRALAGIPNALDVLSNLSFAGFGLLGWYTLGAGRSANQSAQVPSDVNGMAKAFFFGLVLTGAASAYYHHSPDTAGLVVDRMGMVVAFSGLTGLAACLHVSARAGVLVGATVLVAGPLAALHWAMTGNAMPWACIQFGGLLLMLLCSSWAENSLFPMGIHWWAVIGCYALAKILEAADHQVYELSRHLVSGHSLKHLVASLAAWPVYAAVARKMAVLPTAQSTAATA